MSTNQHILCSWKVLHPSPYNMIWMHVSFLPTSCSQTSILRKHERNMHCTSHNCGRGAIRLGLFPLGSPTLSPFAFPHGPSVSIAFAGGANGASARSCGAPMAAQRRPRDARRQSKNTRVLAAAVRTAVSLRRCSAARPWPPTARASTCGCQPQHADAK